MPVLFQILGISLSFFHNTFWTLPEETVLLTLGNLTVSRFPSLSSEKEKKSVTVDNQTFSCPCDACAVRHVCLWSLCQQYPSVVYRMILSMLRSAGSITCHSLLSFISTTPWGNEMKNQCEIGIKSTAFKATVQILFLCWMLGRTCTLYLFLQSKAQVIQNSHRNITAVNIALKLEALKRPILYLKLWVTTTEASKQELKMVYF